METKDNPPPGERHPDKAAPCQVSFIVGDRVSTGTSVHFNDVGMLILCMQPARLNSKLQLSLKFPGMKNPIKVSGEVVWTNIHGPADSLSPRGMGVKFVNLDRDTERLLVDLARNYESYTTGYSCYYT
ncbi:MAG TPA: PilZ domain-containing protein [Syntrophobacteraceae bacterium]|nr:PilZ domain-containing protein [Syntrophobacteraceae bacterium]